MAFSLPSYRVRLQSDYSLAGAIIDRLTGEPVKLPARSVWRFEVGIFAGLNGGIPTAANIPNPTTDDWQTMELMLQSTEGTNVVYGTASAFTLPTAATWLDDTAQHCVIEFDTAQTNIPPARYSIALRLTAADGSFNVGTAFADIIKAYDVNTTGGEPDVNPGSPISEEVADGRYAPISSVVTTGTGLWYLSSGTPSVLTVGSGLTITGSTISATGGGGSGTAYLYADQTFTGINNFGVGTFDPSDSTFGDSPTLRLASGSYVMVAGDETGEAGVISNSGGALVLESALGTNYNVGLGIMYGLPGGTLNLTTQSLTGDWGFTAPPSVTMSGDAPPALVLNRGIAAKSRVLAMKSLEATQPLWTGFAMTVNADYDATLGDYVYDDEAQTIMVLDNEHQWYNPTDRWYQSELNWQANGRRVLNLWTRTQSEVTTVSSGSGVGGVTITTADNHNFSIGTSVYLSVAGTSPALAGSFTVVATPSAKTFTITPATAITGVSTAAQRGTVRATSGNKTVSVASFQVLAPFSVAVPEYDTTDTGERKIGTFEGYSSVTSVPVTMLLQNANSGNAASAVCLRMKGLGNTGGTWWDLSAGYDANSGAYVNGIEIANRLGGGYGVRIRPKSGSASTTQIGINKETPAKELDVVGDGRFTGDVSAATLSGITSLSDSNGEPLLNFIATADAVNQITIVNGATGNAPVITSTGSDADVGLIIGTAGAGNLELGSLGLIAFTGSVAQDVNGAASKPAALFAGTPFAGTGTTSFPLVYINDADATASTTLNTAGTYFGVNGNGTQDLMNLLKDGTSVFKVTSTGAATGTSFALGGATLNSAYLEAPGSTTNSSIKAGNIEIQGFAVNNSWFGDNVYYNGGFVRRAAGYGNLCYFNGGDFYIYSGPTGSAGASITMTNRFGVSNSGAVTVPGTLSVTGASTFTGNVTSNGAFISVPQVLSGSGALTAVSLATLKTTISTSGAATSTLAAGTNGQTKKISMITDGGDAVVTVTNAAWGGAGTATFNDIYDYLVLEYENSKWVVSSNEGVTLA